VAIMNTVQYLIPNYISKKMIILVLVVISLLTTSSTFAYWTTFVEGTSFRTSSSIMIGAINNFDYNFVLNDQVNSYMYKVPLEDLLEDPVNSIDDVLYGIIWNKIEDSNTDASQVKNGELVVNYEIVIRDFEKEVNQNLYNRFSHLINLNVSDNNTNEIFLNSNPVEQEFSVTLNYEVGVNDYKLLEKYNIYILITYVVIPVLESE